MEPCDPRFKLENQLCFPLYAAARKVTGLYTPYFQEIGITYTQYVVFLVLWEQDGISMGELGRRLYLDSGTLTPLLKKMEEKGFVRRMRCPQDERIVQIFLTEAGAHLQERMRDIPEKVGSCVNLTPEESGGLYQLLHKILGTSSNE